MGPQSSFVVPNSELVAEVVAVVYSVVFEELLPTSCVPLYFY